MKFSEGDVVVCPDKRKIGDDNLKTGTIWMLHGNEVMILDIEYFLHKVNVNEIYHSQEPNAEDQTEEA